MLDHKQSDVNGRRELQRDYAEQLLHADFEAGCYCDGDVDVWNPERWGAYCDNWFWSTTETTPDETERDMVRATEEEEAAIADAEHDGWSEMDHEEWLAFLDAIEPTIDELAARDLGDCGLGHPSGEWL